MQLIFLDTETTGNDPIKDRLVQVSYRLKKEGGQETHTEYFKPPIPMSVKAMSITHITDKMLADKEDFAESRMKKDLELLLSSGLPAGEAGVLVAHNARFDIAMLENEGLHVPNFICTLRVARHLDTKNAIPEYNLQFLRYYLGLEVEGNPHDAEGDVNVLCAVFDRLLMKVKEEEKDEESALQEMIEISSRPTLFTYFNFGKHNGKKIEEVAKTNPDYLEWLLNQKITEGATDEDWIYTLKHYLKK